MLTIRPIQAFDDNYIWLLSDPDSASAFVVDPGDAAPVIAALEEAQLQLSGILVTHHHYDHVGGLEVLCEKYSPLVYGPANDSITLIERQLRQGDEIEVLGTTFAVMEVPGHTLDHIAYFADGEQPLLFCGDTLFAGGCGRVFEGTPPMMWQSLSSLATLPETTRIFCAHEYTLANLAFAEAVEPHNQALQHRISEARATRERGEPTVPSTLALELATNPFLRCDQADLLASLEEQGRTPGGRTPEGRTPEGRTPEGIFTTVRGWKDNF